MIKPTALSNESAMHPKRSFHLVLICSNIKLTFLFVAAFRRALEPFVKRVFVTDFLRAQRRLSRQRLDELVPSPPTHRAHGLNVSAITAFNRY